MSNGCFRPRLVPSFKSSCPPSSLVSHKRVVWCKGGSRYAEGWWGFPYFQGLKISKFQKFQSSKIIKCQNVKAWINFQNVWDTQFANSKTFTSQTPQHHLFKSCFGNSWITWSVLVSPKIQNMVWGLKDTSQSPQIKEMKGLRDLIKQIEKLSVRIGAE